MKTQRFVLVLISINVLVIMATFFRANSAAVPETTVVRVRGLELVDDRGRVRCELKVFPADPKVKMPDGTTGYPETVLLRLIDSKGAPNVKISALEDGSGVSFGGPGGYVQILSRGTNVPFIKIVTKDGREKLFDPR